MLAVAACLHQPGRLELLEVLGGVGDGQPGDPGQVLDAALALGQEVEQFQARPVAQGAGDDGQVLEQGLLGGSWWLGHGLGSLGWQTINNDVER